ncbi:MAG: class I SAM-dependent methyltransferase [Paludibacteraceae bacterium]|nr:class I SAM-dependent methyltransferase [Paludibacteraceae bacterium]
MNKEYQTLSADTDPMGAAIAEYQKKKKAGKLRVLSEMFDEDEIPVDYLFRTYKEMPAIEQKALDLAKGDTLDVGAGSGCHSLALQQLKGDQIGELTAIDISALSCEAMKAQGLKDVRCVNLMDPSFDQKFDTILLLMNGTGIAGKLERLPMLLNRLRQLLKEGGQVLIDSSDLCYLYEDEDGDLDMEMLEGDYYGEVVYQMRYKNVKGEDFDWLYTDFKTLQTFALNCGFECEKVMDGEHYEFLARLTVKA